MTLQRTADSNETEGIGGQISINSLMMSSELRPNFLYYIKIILLFSNRIVKLKVSGRSLPSPSQDASPRQLRKKGIMRSNSAGVIEHETLSDSVDLDKNHFSVSVFYRGPLTLSRPTKPEEGMKLVLNPVAHDQFKY